VTPLLLLLLAYSVGLVVLGAWIGRSVRKSEDYFVGGRALGAGLLFSTFLAANIGAGSTVNATGLAYHHGLAAWWWNGSAGIGTIILALWIGPRIWALASARGYLTVGDFLEDRFGRNVRFLAAVLIWIGSLSIYAAQIIGASAVLQRVGGVSPTTGALISVVAMTAYFVSGGLLSAAWVNRVQLLVILSGFALAAPMLITRAGGLEPVLQAVPASSFLTGTAPGIVGVGWPAIFLMAPAFFLSPGLVQRAFSARSAASLRRGVGWSGVALMAFAFAPVAIGMAARVLLPELETAPRDQVLPGVLVSGVPWLVGSIALAAVFSAEISSADAVLFMLSTSGARDFYRGYVNPDASDAQLLRVARGIAIVAGGLGFGLAFVHQTVLDALQIFYSILGVTLLAPILGGLLVPKAGRAAAMTAMVAGVVVLFAAQRLIKAPAILTAMNDLGIAWMTPSFVGLTVSTAAFLLVAALRRRDRRV
jgi:SSS family solute:Na+ symporter